jgi:hypothetical protein
MKPKNMRNRARGHLDSSSPDSRHRLESIFNAVWGELRQYPDRESVKKQVAERVALYSNSGLQDDQRIKLAVLNSFGRAG